MRRPAQLGQTPRPFSRERDEEIVTARVASRSKEAVREDAASEVAPELALDVLGQRRVVRLARVRENVARCARTTS
jgi:hypothetical protein